MIYHENESRNKERVRFFVEVGAEIGVLMGKIAQ
jgi:hypothetical protein